MSTDIQLRHDTLNNWNTANCILKVGEIGIDTTNWRVRIGDGVNTWSDLEPFLNALNANHHELAPKATNNDLDEYVIWDSVSGTYLTQNRRDMLNNDSITTKIAINDLKGIVTDITNNSLFYCVATDSIYKYLVSGGPVAHDDKYVVSGAVGGSRFVAIGGNVIYDAIDISAEIKINGIKVIGPQMVSRPDGTISTSETPSGTYGVTEQEMLANLKSDVSRLTNQVNDLLSVMRVHGIISY